MEIWSVRPDVEGCVLAEVSLASVMIHDPSRVRVGPWTWSDPPSSDAGMIMRLGEPAGPVDLPFVCVVRLVQAVADVRSPPLHVAIADPGALRGTAATPLALLGAGSLAVTVAFAVVWYAARRRSAPATPRVGSAAAWVRDAQVALVVWFVSQRATLLAVLPALSRSVGPRTPGNVLQDVQPPLGVVALAIGLLALTAPLGRLAAVDLWVRVHPLAAVLGCAVLCGVAGASFGLALAVGSFTPTWSFLAGYFVSGVLYGAVPCSQYLLFRMRERPVWPAMVGVAAWAAVTALACVLGPVGVI